MPSVFTAFALVFACLTAAHAQLPAPGLEGISPLSAEEEGHEQDIFSMPPPVEHPVTFEESDFNTKPWMKDFEWVIVINKADKGDDRQSLRIYQNQKLLTADEIIAATEEMYGADYMGRFSRDLKKRLWAPDVFKISTGREEFERRGQHGASRDSFTITPSGFFVPQYITYRHKSEAYSNKTCGSGYVVKRVVRGRYPNQWVEKVYRRQPKCVYMEKVVFFNNSIALHKAASGTEGQLGQRASGGCVRLPASVAMYLFVTIKHASGAPMPKINQDGTVELDGNNQVVKVDSNTTIWGKLNARAALIIVQNKFVEPKPSPKPPRRPGRL
ncbi:MAG: L,D-transpeptidase [Bdellovibrionaceae bacterium]|nr:L,D-transpeptidase [Pseudobdellovibrionaceae bacterium]MBX3032535.1 L,D-transpeptidase [Pseudobdellovibrionaceae bacterium]